jgi:hypothetical protein
MRDTGAGVRLLGVGSPPVSCPLKPVLLFSILTFDFSRLLSCWFFNMSAELKTHS